MMFRPKYCCNCGEKIERAEWRIWTSRRFCPLCETEYKHLDILPVAIVSVGALMTVAGAWNWFASPKLDVNAETVKRSIEDRKELKAATLYPGNNMSPASAPGSPANKGENAASSNGRQINEQPQRSSRTSEEQVFYCGAMTKKGTPCTRRVKAKGFCWQHARTGQVAPARF